MNYLSIEDGIKIQDEHLADWELKLNKEVYDELFKYAKKDNDKAFSGFDITRGQDLSSFVQNYKFLKVWRYKNSTETIWCSFDTGEVKAYTYEEAKRKALDKIKLDLAQANFLMKSFGFTIEMNLYEIEVYEVTNEKD